MNESTARSPWDETAPDNEQRIGLRHHYAEHPGVHDWDYWDAHVPAALQQHARALVIAKIAE